MHFTERRIIPLTNKMAHYDCGDENKRTFMGEGQRKQHCEN